MDSKNWEDKLKENHPHIQLGSLIQEINKTKKKMKPVNKDFDRLRKCSTKKMLYKTLNMMETQNKEILLFFVRNCLTIELLTRKVMNRWLIFNKRELLLNCIEDPEILMIDCRFDNNLIKNFCVGTVNFICRYKEEIEKELNKNN